MKRISVILVALVASLVTTFSVAPPTYALPTEGCTAKLPDTTPPPDIEFKNSSGKELGFGGLKVIKAVNFDNIYCVKFSTGGRNVQRYDAYTKLNLTSTGACPVPGGYGGGFEPPYGMGYNKQLYVEKGTCYRVLYGIKYGGDYYYATFMRKRI